MPRQIAVLVATLGGGGAERVAVDLATGLSALSLPVDLVVCDAGEGGANGLREDVRLVNLDTGAPKRSVPAFLRYIKENDPGAVIAIQNNCNVLAIIGRMLSRRSFPAVITLHNVPTKPMGSNRTLRSRLRASGLRMMYGVVYPVADSVVAVSYGVKREWEDAIPTVGKCTRVIYNPVVNGAKRALATVEPPHEWHRDACLRVVTGAGRLRRQKGFDLLLSAFARLREGDDNLRLIILGEGPERPNLERQIRKLGLYREVCMPGFVENPFAYMSHSELFVLSSRWEGFGLVLVEALMCGVPVVSTDCPAGPSEILEGGKYGILVKPNDAVALAAGIRKGLSTEVGRGARDERIQRADIFSVEKAVSQYFSLLLELGYNGRPLDRL